MELQLALRRNEGGCRTPPAPDEAVVRELVLAKSVEAPDLATVKDFLRFKAAAGKGMITEQTTCDSLNTFAEWFFAPERNRLAEGHHRGIRVLEELVGPWANSAA